MEQRQFECAICGNTVSWYNALCVGGMIEQKTGKKFLCRECAAKWQEEKFDLKVVLLK